MSLYTLADVLSKCRQTVGDTAAGAQAVVRLEELSGINGTVKDFNLKNYPVKAASVVVKKNGTTLTLTTDYAVDADNGILTFVSAPVLSPTKDLVQVTYGFYVFGDTTYHTFIAGAARSCGFAPVGADDAAQAVSAVSLVPDQMVDALVFFVAALFCDRRATETAVKFGGSAGGQATGPEVMTRAFRQEAESWFGKAVQLRDDYYKRKGAREAPSFAIGNFTNIKNSTPRRA